MNKYQKEYCLENGLVSINAENAPLSEYIEHLENKLAQTEQLILSGVIVSGVGKYNKMVGIHDKYTCPICGNSPDVVHPNIQESTCFKDEIKWEYN